ncbi:MAG: putative metalloprotease CJM1_0395 family protein, partial [Myxococcota bacterium]|nr:putative metalloprotease CJM1_0395 family protein [Myxococcota bacterium]
MSSFGSLNGLSLSLSSLYSATSGTLNSDAKGVSSLSMGTHSQSDLHSNLNDDSVRYIAVPAPAVKVELSFEARSILNHDQEGEAVQRKRSTDDDQDIGGKKSLSGRTLSEEEVRVIQELKSRDAEVRAHENAHISAAGGLASAATYTYQSGPDGKRYAIGGHVSIDTSPGRTPKETLIKAERIRSAALAPADPSPQDRAVASQASQMAANARAEINANNQEEAKKALEGSGATEGSSEGDNATQGSEATNVSTQASDTEAKKDSVSSITGEDSKEESGLPATSGSSKDSNEISIYKKTSSQINGAEES